MTAFIGRGAQYLKSHSVPTNKTKLIFFPTFAVFFWHFSLKNSTNSTLKSYKKRNGNRVGLQKLIDTIQIFLTSSIDRNAIT